MSTATLRPPRALFAGLIDDAAVFPPGNFPLPEAISRRLAREGAPCQDLVGPLLLPPRLVPDALESPPSLAIAVVGRPDVPLADTLTAARAVAASPAHVLAGLEIGYASGWREALHLDAPLSVEVPAAGFDTVLDDLSKTDGDRVRAKLRTGSTPANPVPTPQQLADFIAGSIGRSLGFKLTGGMHRAVSHRAATPDGGEDQFGFLNVLLATDELSEGGSVTTAVEVLAQRDHGAVAALVAALDSARTTRTRSAFRSYGCCDVLDPIRDLSDLNLIEETP